MTFDSILSPVASNSRSMGQQNQSITLSTDTKPILPSNQQRPASKKAHGQSSHADRPTHQSKPTNKTNKSSTAGGVSKRPKPDPKKNRTKQSAQQVIPNETMLMSTGLSSKPLNASLSPGTPATSSNKKTVKSVTNAVISYLHYRGANGGQAAGRSLDASTTHPRFFSPSHSEQGQRADGTIVVRILFANPSLYSYSLLLSALLRFSVRLLLRRSASKPESKQ